MKKEGSMSHEMVGVNNMGTVEDARDGCDLEPVYGKRLFSRRDALKMIGGGGVGFVVTAIFRSQENVLSSLFNNIGMSGEYDSVLKIFLEKESDTMTFEEVSQLAIRLGNAYHSMSLEKWKPELTQTALEQWVYEVSLQMQAGGLIDEAKLPDDLSFFKPKNGKETNNVLGYSDCDSLVRLNTRFVNPMASWHNSPAWLGTVVHEMVHFAAQGWLTCTLESSEVVEEAANLGMMYTLAGMAVRNNAYAFRSFVYELTGMTLGAAMAMAIKNGNMEDYYELRKQVFPGAIDKMRTQKTMREWSPRMTELSEIVNKYEYKPLNNLLTAYKKNGNVVFSEAFDDILTKSDGTGVLSLDMSDVFLVMEYLEELAQHHKVV